MTPSTPSDYSDDMLLVFLRRKLAGEPLPPAAAAAAHFHDADIYAADPATLTSVHEPAPGKKGDGDSWFFFTHVKAKSSRDTRKSRQVAGGVGTWHSERAPRAVFDDKGNCIGHFQYFSYKMKTDKNCSARTQWYMLEFSDGDQANHDRILGGDPVLVLCKIYKAHSSRSSTVRKRKPTDELLNQASSPVRAKRRLFDSPAAISSVAEAKPEEPETAQENLGSKASYNLQLQGKSNATLDSAFRFELDPLPDKDNESIIQRFWTEAKTEATEAEAHEASQEKQLQDKRNAKLDLAFRFELDPLQDKVNESIIQRFWTEARTEVTEEHEASQEKQLQDKRNATLDSVFRYEVDPSHDIIQRFWTSETEGSQVDRSTMSCSFLMAGGALPMHVNCAPEVALSSTSPVPAHCAPRAFSSAIWIGNDITASCSSELGCVVGAPNYNELGGIAGVRFTGEPDVRKRNMPFAPVPPTAAASSWLFSGPDIWSC